MKFQDQYNSVQVIFGQGSQISQPPWYSPGPKTACFYFFYIEPEFWEMATEQLESVNRSEKMAVLPTRFRIL